MLTPDQRERFASLADLLIPAAEGMPSASQAEVPTRWLDDALGYRPDLVPALNEALQAAGDLPADEAIEVLNRDHIPAFEAFGTLTAGAYFLNPDVRQLIGYPGQVATPPKDDTHTYFDLLENVVERGQVYRDVPGVDQPS
ncbi:hypothetical protein [Streptomyces sp. NBC_01314]|uniref:hypothetical protein n=1 Tax=Streptomyces sp. NBC_01314 TaxID=2903821 RepID=UPI003092C273|nr:hypothetical protein OG622_07905 [Streptomyces sp. NBC_01314]